MASNKNSYSFTVQERDTPVPVGVVGDVAGPTRPSSSDCYLSEVGNQAQIMENATGTPRTERGKTILSKSPVSVWGNIFDSPATRRSLNNSQIDMTWDDTSGKSITKKRKLENEVFDTNNLPESDNIEKEKERLYNKFKRLMESLELVSNALGKEVTDNATTKRSVKTKALELRSIVTQMSTSSMKEMLEGIHRSSHLQTARPTEKNMTESSTQTPVNDRGWSEIEQAEDIRKELSRCSDLEDLVTLIKKDWPESSFINTRPLGANQLKDQSTAVIVHTTLEKSDSKRLGRILQPQLRSAIENGHLQAGNILINIKKSSLETDSALTEEEEKHTFAIGINKESTMEDFVVQLTKGIEKTKQVCENRDLSNLCYVIDGTEHASITRKILEYVYRHEVNANIYYLPYVKGQRKPDTEETTPKGDTSTKNNTEEWRQPRQRKSEIIKIKLNNEQTTLEETARKMQQNINLDDMGVQVQRININRGALTIKFRSKEEEGDNKFRQAVANNLGEQGTVETARKKKTLIVRRIDIINTEEDIKLAIQEITKTTSFEIKLLVDKRRRDKRTAIVTLAEAPALEMLTSGQIKIGWTSCKVMELLTPPKCYRCYDFGHFADKCGKTDHMKTKCLRCCEEGHRAVECQNLPKCYQCDKEGHTAGTMACPAYKKMVEDIRKEQKQP